jgi:hypothetical protein
MNTNSTPRKVVSQIRHACDGTLLHQPVRALATPRRTRTRARREAALRETRRHNREAYFQSMAVVVLGAIAILFVAALVTATVSDAAGAVPKLNHGLAAIGRFMGGLLS